MNVPRGETHSPANLPFFTLVLPLHMRRRGEIFGLKTEHELHTVIVFQQEFFSDMSLLHHLFSLPSTFLHNKNVSRI